MLVDFDGQLILTRRQIIKAVRAAVRDPPSFKFGTGRSCDFFSGRLEEDQRCLERCVRSPAPLTLILTSPYRARLSFCATPQMLAIRITKQTTANRKD
jgi:hypothetical protein